VTAHPAEQLSAYLDGELAAAERAAVEAHLRTCGVCTRAVAEMRAIDQASRDLPVEAPVGYFEALPGRVRSRLQQRRTAAPRRALWAVAAAAVLAAVVSPFVLLQRPAPTPPARQAPAAAVLAPPATVVPQLAAPTPLATPAAAKEPAALARRPYLEEQARVAPPAAPPATTAPPPPAAQPARPAEGRLEKKAEEADAVVMQDELRDRRADRQNRAPERRPAAREPMGFMEVDDYAQLAARRPRSAAEARRLRDAWRAWAKAHPERARGDEATVRAMEAGAEAWRLGRDPRDLAQLRQDAETYLARADAPQKDRVRALLEKTR
jgi:hypothetical protein